jgi:serine/threonine protein kinase
VEHGISDLWFPFPKQTLRHFLNDGKSEKNFLRVQAELFQEVWPDPMVEPVPHLIFDDGEEIVKSKRILGEGGFAIVEEVTLPTTPLPTVCVRKRIDRHRQLRTQKQIMEAFIREIKIMGLVDHHHCVKFLGSYTDHDSLCILSLPIADMDLATYLKVESLNREQLEVIRRGMGCLCNALHYLHEEEIRSVFSSKDQGNCTSTYHSIRNLMHFGGFVLMRI